MLCDFCHEREAVFFIEQINANSRRKINICMECAVKRGISPDPKIVERSIGTLFAELARDISRTDPDTDRLCPVCGQSLARIRQTGKLGCPECYAIFRDEITDLMKQKGIKGPYTGSMPRRLASFHSILTDRVDLQAKLEDSIRKEDYEKAALYRDYLRALERYPVAGSVEPASKARISDNRKEGKDNGADQ
jgi:protein arginine kinase activator